MQYSLNSYFSDFDSLSYRKLRDLRWFSKTVDIYQACIEDIFRIDNPHIPTGTNLFNKSFKDYQEHMLSSESYRKNTLVLKLPWRQEYYIIPNRALYNLLRTSRNRYLISEEDQAKFRSSTIGIAGLSVGSNILNTLVLTSGPYAYSLADGDTLSLTNMNRIFDSLANIGESKLTNVMNKNLELDPFLCFNYESEYLTADGFNNFFFINGDKLSLFFEEMDDISLKIKSRFFARKHRIPVVMLTDNGDNVIIDVERFDTEPTRRLFHGLIEEEKYVNIPAKLSQVEKVKLANDIVGPDIVPLMRDSLQMVGSRLPTWPQLGTAALLSGVVGSYVARSIICNSPKIKSGRYRVDIDSILDSEYFNNDTVMFRENHKQSFIRSMDIIFGSNKGR